MLTGSLSVLPGCQKIKEQIGENLIVRAITDGGLADYHVYERRR